MDQKIPIFKIYWDESDIDLVTKVIRRGSYWTLGTETVTFEKMLCEYIGAKYTAVFNSGTSALHAALLANKIGPGDEVIVPSFTFIATANAPLFVGATPVFADIEKQTCGLDPVDVLKKINPKTKAILPIHFGGLPCHILELQKIAIEHNLLLIEDAAEAFGACIGTQKTGTFGNSSILSFCQNKIITTGEGGAVVTDDKDVYERLKLVRSHGRLEIADYFASSVYMDYVTLGYNFRISEITAALGISQLAKVEKIISMRRKNAEYLKDKLYEIDQLYVQVIPSNYTHVYQMFNIRLKDGYTKREQLIDFLSSKGISSKVNFYPVHLTKFYREQFGHKIGDLPVTEEVSAQSVTLPMYPTMTNTELDYIAEQIKEFFRNN